MKNNPLSLVTSQDPALSARGFVFWITRFDWWLAAGIFLLIVLGSMTILSTVIAPGVSLFKDTVFATHLFNATIGIILFLVFSVIDYRLLRHFSWFLYVLMIAILGLVLVIGFTSRGSVRWIDLGFFRFQPSELAKIFFIISMAAYFSSIKERIAQFRYVLFSIGLMAVPTALVLLEPDLGTGLVFIAIWAGMLILSGARIRHLVILGILSIATLPIAWFFILAPYQKDRIHVFIDPKIDPLGKGYAVIQSIIAVGSGKLLGRGWGRGTQSHLQFLPERHTDFIFATLAEELGYLGVIILLGAFSLVLFRILRIAQHASDSFGGYICIGFFTLIIFHAIVNIGMNIGIMPITGIPLPLVSYGGSALIVNLIGLGIVESVAVRRQTASQSMMLGDRDE